MPHLVHEEGLKCDCVKMKRTDELQVFNLRRDKVIDEAH